MTENSNQKWLAKRLESVDSDIHAIAFDSIVKAVNHLEQNRLRKRIGIVFADLHLPDCSWIMATIHKFQQVEPELNIIVTARKYHEQAWINAQAQGAVDFLEMEAARDMDDESWRRLLIRCGMYKDRVKSDQEVKLDFIEERLNQLSVAEKRRLAERTLTVSH